MPERDSLTCSTWRKRPSKGFTTPSKTGRSVAEGWCKPTSTVQEPITVSVLNSSQSTVHPLLLQAAPFAQVRHSVFRRPPSRSPASYQTSTNMLAYPWTWGEWSSRCRIRPCRPQFGMVVGIPNAGQTESYELGGGRGICASTTRTDAFALRLGSKI